MTFTAYLRTRNMCDLSVPSTDSGKSTTWLYVGLYLFHVARKLDPTLELFACQKRLKSVGSNVVFR